MNYSELVAFADKLTSVCPVDKDGRTNIEDIRHAIMCNPGFFPFINPKLEHLAEEAECVAKCLDDAGVPKTDGDRGLSLWGRLLHWANDQRDPRGE